MAKNFSKIKNQLVGCPDCDSKNLEVIEGHVDPKSKIRVNELWFRCRNCGKESPVLQEEIEIAKEILIKQKEKLRKRLRN